LAGLQPKSIINELRPEIVVRSIRGNIDSRLTKLACEDYDAIIIAKAGLARLGIADRISEEFSTDIFVPAPGQGAIAIQTLESRHDMIKLLSSIEDISVRSCVTAERSFSKAIGGGCKTPIGAIATIRKNIFRLRGYVGTVQTISGRRLEISEETAIEADQIGLHLASKYKSKLARLKKRKI